MSHHKLPLPIILTWLLEEQRAKQLEARVRHVQAGRMRLKELWPA